MKTIFSVISCLALAGSLAASSTVWTPSAYVVPSKGGNFLFRVDPPTSGGESTASVFEFDAKEKNYRLRSRFASATLTHRIDDDVLIVVENSNGEILCLNQAFHSDRDVPLLCVVSADGKEIVRRTLGDLLEPAEVQSIRRAAAKAETDGLGFRWVASVRTMDDGTYWLELDDAHREGMKDYVSNFLILSPAGWKISRHRDSDVKVSQADRDAVPLDEAERPAPPATSPAAQKTRQLQYWTY